MFNFKKDDVIFYRKVNGNVDYGKAIIPTCYAIDGSAIVVIEEVGEDDKKPSPPFCLHALFDKDIMVHFDSKYEFLCNSKFFLEEFCQNLNRNAK